jgi:hypothetical protein
MALLGIGLAIIGTLLLRRQRMPACSRKPGSNLTTACSGLGHALWRLMLVTICLVSGTPFAVEYLYGSGSLLCGVGSALPT